MKRRKTAKSAEPPTHGGAKRRNAPTAEARPPMADEDKTPACRPGARPRDCAAWPMTGDVRVDGAWLRLYVTIRPSTMRVASESPPAASVPGIWRRARGGSA